MLLLFKVSRLNLKSYDLPEAEGLIFAVLNEFSVCSVSLEIELVSR